MDNPIPSSVPGTSVTLSPAVRKFSIVAAALLLLVIGAGLVRRKVSV